MSDIYFVKQKTDFTRTEHRIINYIIENPDSFILMSFGDAAKCIGTSEPTISRFARHCGYADFKELKNAILLHRSEQNSPSGKLSATLVNQDSGTAEGFLRYQQACIEKTLSFLDQELLSRAVSEICSAETVYLYAKGASVSMAELLKFRLTRFGIRVILLPPGSSELFEYMNLFTAKDLLILFGFQKTPREADVLLSYREKIHFPCIFFTSRLYHDRAQEDIIPLYVYRGEPTEYHSMAAPAALIDALVVRLAAELGDASKDRLDSLYQLKEAYKTEIPR